MTTDLKAPGNWLYVVGLTRDELGGSAYYRLHGWLGANPPQPPTDGAGPAARLHRAIAAGLVRACHDCSEGGLAVAAAEMAWPAGWGWNSTWPLVPQFDGASHRYCTGLQRVAGRFLVEVRPEDAAAFEACLAGLPLARRRASASATAAAA